MLVIFDENLPPRIVHILKDLCEDASVSIESTRSLELNGEKDIPLFGKLHERAGDDKLVLITGDTEINRNSPAIQALKEAGVIAFICPRKLSQKGLVSKITYILNMWEALCAVAKSSKIKKVYRLPPCPNVTASQITDMTR